MMSARWGLRPGTCPAPFRAHRREPLQQVLHFSGGDAGAVHRIGGRKTATRRCHATQIGERATRANEGRGGPVAQRELATELAPHLFAQLADGLPGYPRRR